MSEWKQYDETTFTDFGSVGETVPAEMDMTMGSDRTVPEGGWGDESFEKTMADDATARDPWNNTEATSFVDSGWQLESGEQVRPCTGWLVCVAGPSKGKDFRIYKGNTYIGRGQQNQVAIPDQTISNGANVCVDYEEKTRKFFITKVGTPVNPIELNDETLRESKELAPYDIISLGNSKLMFVPLCTEKFAWEE